MKFSKYNLLGIFFLFCGLPASATYASFECLGEIQTEGAYRTTPSRSGIDTLRAFAGLDAKYAMSRQSAQAKATVWAWKNFYADRFHLTEGKVELRKLTLGYWGSNWGLSAGVQSIHWGETFGIEASDLVQARNYLDYSFLDLSRNKIPAFLVVFNRDFHWIEVQTLFNPNGEYPILPASLNGLPVTNLERKWFQDPEFGAKITIPLTSANIDLLAYRHQSRLPSLVLDSPTRLKAVYRTVTSAGLSGSRSFSEIVARLDSLITFNEPRTSISTTVAMDWTPTFISDSTIGFQGHFDRYPIIGTENQFALSLLIRKAFFQGKWESSLQIYQGIQYRDTRYSPTITWRLGTFELAVAAEIFNLDNSSPLRVLEPATRYTMRLGVKF